jgi:transcription initiation factor TFIIA large subunit
MSNFETSKLYETIIEDVINDSRQDFEDSGIDELTLQDLRRIWCEKLTQSQVAKFSWDEVEFEDPSLQNHNILPSGSSQNQRMSQPLVSSHINSGLELPNMVNASDLSYSAVANTNNIGIEIPHIQETDVDSATGLMLPNINQADGTFEFTIVSGEGGKFMEALKKKQKKKKIGQADGALGDDDDEDDDDIFNDSDDINSDLDDGLDSDQSDDDDGDQEGQIMLCLYDKVQRIKSKWKSNLKEGIANIDGKDYVFQKATGESEWS